MSTSCCRIAWCPAPRGPTTGFPHADHDDGPDALGMAVRLATQLLTSTRRRGPLPQAIGELETLRAFAVDWP